MISDYTNLRDHPDVDLRVAFDADPSLPGLDDPYSVYADLRAESSVHWCSGPQMWAVLGYQDAAAMMHDKTLARQPECDRLAERYGNSDIYTRQKLDLPYMDGERHRVMRRHVMNAYNAIDFESLRVFLRQFADERLASVQDQDSFDLVSVLSADLPVYVVSQLIGVPASEQAQAAEVVGEFVAARGLVQTEDIASGGDSAVSVFEDFFLPLIHERRARRQDDLTSRLIADPVDGMTMSDEQMLLLLSSNFYAASMFTIRLFVATMAMAMARFPDVYRQVRTDPTLIPTAVEEVLRWDPPAQAVNSSMAMVDLQFGDITVPAGDALTVMVGAANRDPAQFPDPDAVRLDRQPNRHLSFAPGVHACLGLHLARMEGAVALEAMTHHLPEFGYDADASVRFVGDRFRGFDSLIIQR